MAKGPNAADSFVKAADGTVPVVVASWNDRVGDLFNELARTGVPSNIVLPKGDNGLWVFFVTETTAHPKFVTPWDPETPLVEFIRDVWRRETVAVCLDTTQLELHLHVA